MTIYIHMYCHITLLHTTHNCHKIFVFFLDALLCRAYVHYVHAPIKESGERIQDVDISYDLIGILPYSLLKGLQNGETA